MNYNKINFVRDLFLTASFTFSSTIVQAASQPLDSHNVSKLISFWEHETKLSSSSSSSSSSSAAASNSLQHTGTATAINTTSLKINHENPQQLIQRLFGPQEGKKLTVMVPGWDEMVLTFSRQSDTHSKEDHLAINMCQATPAEAQKFSASRMKNYRIPSELLQTALPVFPPELVELTNSYIYEKRDIVDAIPVAIIPNLRFLDPQMLHKSYPIPGGTPEDRFEFSGSNRGFQIKRHGKASQPIVLSETSRFQQFVESTYKNDDFRMLRYGPFLPIQVSKGLFYTAGNTCRFSPNSQIEEINSDQGHLFGWPAFQLSEQLVGFQLRGTIGGYADQSHGIIYRPQDNFKFGTTHPAHCLQIPTGLTKVMRVDHLIMNAKSGESNWVNFHRVSDLKTAAENHNMPENKNLPCVSGYKDINFTAQTIAALPFISALGSYPIPQNNGGYRGWPRYRKNVAEASQIYFCDTDGTPYLLVCRLSSTHKYDPHWPNLERYDSALLLKLLYQ